MRLGLVDDDPLTLAALRALANGWRAEHGMAVVWAVRSGDEAVERCVDVHSRPDVVLVDMGMDGVDGAATCARIRLCSDSIVLLAITCHSLRHYRDAARRSGAQALLDKADMAGLRRCLAACAAGEPYVQDGFPSPPERTDSRGRRDAPIRCPRGRPRSWTGPSGGLPHGRSQTGWG